jgi:predicted ATP-dependent endonuclease of OLD family
MASILLSLEQNSPNNILLIDEVETHIHIDGQIKLFDFLSSFSEKNQIIFSTISPFMINSNPNINYLIFDKDEKHYSKAENKKYLEPNGISKIYGVNIYEYFLNPKKIVIFEGKIDREFFEYILTKNNFDFTDIRFLEANGASKIPAEIE